MQQKVHPEINKYLFDLPPECIATEPVHPFDHCKLLILDRRNKEFTDKHFYDLPDFLSEGDLLIVNNSKVEARRVFMRRETQVNNRGHNKGHYQGARIETVFLNRTKKSVNGNYLWRALIRKRQRLLDGEFLFAEEDPSIRFKVHKYKDGRTFLEEPVLPKGMLKVSNEAMFSKIGQMPIPPYLNREAVPGDIESYQNPFAEKSKEEFGGSAAAPTASLHFTEELLSKVKEKDAIIESVTLHIGYGTFAPLTKENLDENKLHSEFYSMPDKTAKRIRDKDYNRLIAVGTTALRTLETVHRLSGGRYESFLEGETEIFLRPPQKIVAADALITNFHLPGSSLLMLVSCMSGRDKMMRAYQHAINSKYRFFSYGDAMFIC